MIQTQQVTVVRGPRELYERTSHLFERTTGSLDCAAKDLVTWHNARHDSIRAGVALRKLYRPSALLDPSLSQHLHTMVERGAGVRISDEEISETIILDRKVAILAGDTSHGERSYSIVAVPEVVHGVLSLFDAAWRAATDFAVYDRDAAELRRLAPRILDHLNTGATDEAAARALDLSVRTYRRRVAELMAALGASSRFQAGARAQELGLI
ncbi:response regulator transcription factor [Nocardia sp. BMG51109]|uniref:response regulator transcription factor n=1 Tax=Nocardia sp. BMG51109 TaxID=1056816 RepID=UPI000467297A|nr:response regulator transcription factor [Nocardia sp. BMG51109]